MTEKFAKQLKSVKWFLLTFQKVEGTWGILMSSLTSASVIYLMHNCK